MSTNYARYSDDVETIAPDESETFQKIVEAMGKGGKIARERYGKSVRVSHAKAHGLLSGELVIADGLPDALRQGLFAVPGRHDVVVRLAQVPGEYLDDRKVSTPRGMAIKVLGVNGEKLAGHEGTTQDFLLDTGKVFNAPSAKVFLAAITATEAATPMGEGLKQAVSTASRLTNKALNAVGLNSANLEFYGHPFNHPLGESYYSQAAIRYGDYIAKIRARPDTPGLASLAEKPFDPQDENGLRSATIAFFKSHPAEFEIAVQLCTNLDRMPVEDASKDWLEDESPYVPVGRLILPVQEAYAKGAVDRLDEGSSFCVSHSLSAHRPLGSIMRARMHAYPLLGGARLRDNDRPVAEPSDRSNAELHA